MATQPVSLPARSPRPARRPRLTARSREALTGYAFIAPNLALFAVFMFLPLALVFVKSTQESSGIGPSEYVGLRNFSELASDGVFWRSMANSPRTSGID